MLYSVTSGLGLLICLAWFASGWMGGPGMTAYSQSREREVRVEEVGDFFRQQNKRILTFIGYSGSGYEDVERMIARAEAILRAQEPHATLINIGATPDGIGAVYELAKRLGFVTTGIVSSVARTYHVALSPHVDHVFYVRDETWGGFLPGTETLSPASQAMVENSDAIIAIGGGAVGRDELIAAQRLAKPLQFIAADMNHRKALEKAKEQGKPTPTDFRGAAHLVFGTKASDP